MLCVNMFAKSCFSFTYIATLVTPKLFRCAKIDFSGRSFVVSQLLLQILMFAVISATVIFRLSSWFTPIFFVSLYTFKSQNYVFHTLRYNLKCIVIVWVSRLLFIYIYFIPFHSRSDTKIQMMTPLHHPSNIRYKEVRPSFSFSFICKARFPPGF